MTAALTPEQWAALRYEETDGGRVWAWRREYAVWGGKEFGSCNEAAECGAQPSAQGRHATAALALYGQPFGFTQRDVDDLLILSGNERLTAIAGHDTGMPARLANLATRVAALLPPPEGQ